MRAGRPVAVVTVTAEQRLELESWSRRPKTAQALAMRSRIVLLAAHGGSNKSIALKLSTTAHTVGKWRKRFATSGNDGLLDEPRPGTSRKLSDKQVELVLARTLESQPEAATHWSTRDMAKACGLSQSTVSRIWRAFSLAPHRSETFRLSRDPLFAALDAKSGETDRTDTAPPSLGRVSRLPRHHREKRSGQLGYPPDSG